MHIKLTKYVEILMTTSVSPHIHPSIGTLMYFFSRELWVNMTTHFQPPLAPWE